MMDNYNEAKYLVTIGIPVFNEEKYLAKTIESAINQTYKNIKILISDNCSDDNSYKIAKEYEAIDSRITVYKQPKNILGANFEFLLKTAESEYFCFLGGHDLLRENYVEEVLNIFLSNSKIVGVYAQVEYFKNSTARILKAEKSSVGVYPQVEIIEHDMLERENWCDRFNTLNLNSYGSFKNIIGSILGGNSYYGVYKRDVMLKTFFSEQEIGFGDLGALLRTSLYGFIVPTQSVCSYFRIVRAQETDEQMDERYKSYKFPDNWRLIHSTYPAVLVGRSNSFSFIEKIKLNVGIQRRIRKIHPLKWYEMISYYVGKSEFKIAFILGVSYLYIIVRRRIGVFGI